MDRENRIAPAVELRSASASDRTLKYEQYAGYALLLIFAVSISIGQITDDDVFWHLATGRWIAAHQTVPSHDVFGYVTAGEPWIPFEWGWDLLTYGIYTLGNGYLLLQLLPALLACGIVLFLIGTMRRQEIPPPVIICVSLLVLLASLFSFQIRPYTASLLFFSATIYLLISFRYRSGSSARSLLFLPPIFLVWANMHPGVIGGIFLFGIFVAGETIDYFWCNRAFPSPRAITRKDLGFLGAVFAMSAAALLVNPHGVDTYIYVYRHTQLHLITQVVEWLPPLTTDFETRINWFYKLLLVLGAASIFTAVRRRDLLPAMLYCGFAIYSFRSVRFVADFALITAAGTALGLTMLADSAGNIGKLLRGRAASAIMAVVTLLLILMAVNDTLYKELRYHRHTGFGIDRHYFSAGLIQFMKAEGISGRPLNTNGVGGQLVWELPGELNFIDSRNLSDSIWNEYYAIQSRSPGFENKLAQYGVDYIIVSLIDLVQAPKTMSGSLIPYCTAHPADWRLVYWDDRTFLYLKTVPKFDACSTRYGYAILDPYRYAFAFRQFDSLAVTAPNLFRTELKRKIDEEPGGFLTKSFLEYGKRRGIVQ